MTVIDWLLPGDPAMRWQVLRDLEHAPADVVAAERARVEHEGWGARLLQLEDPDGLWDGGACFPASYRGGEPGQPWTATMHTLQTLRLPGLEPASEAAPTLDCARRRERTVGARRAALLRRRGGAALRFLVGASDRPWPSISTMELATVRTRFSTSTSRL